VGAYRLARPLLFRLEPERAHAVAKRGLRAVAALPPLAARWRRRNLVDDPRLAQEVFGRRFANPVGLAAGFDKDGEALAAVPALGFGFAEAGTVTPEPQPGNPRPRIFRHPAAESLQNRLGFNNRGAAALARRLDRLGPLPYPLGVNLGKNRDTPPERALDDYRRLLATFGRRADVAYLVINVSSPNTPGLRALQDERFLAAVLGAARELADRPVLVKLDPDQPPERAAELAAAAVEAGAAGIVATNTSADLALLPGADPGGGGLSGAVLRDKSFRTLRAVAGAVAGRAVLIAAGGIDSAEEAYRRIRAGAALVQLYTALVYRGPDLIGEINRGLLALLDRDGFATLAEAVGADLDR
jgi:dihydroorotate dehydrogenase